MDLVEQKGGPGNVVWFPWADHRVPRARVIQGQVPPAALLIPLGVAAWGYVMMRWLIFSLMDEVWIDNDDIVVRNRDCEDRFPVTNIINAEAPLFWNPERIVLTLRKPCRFGGEVAFSPPHRYWPMSRNPLANELIRRAHGVDEDRSNAP